MPLWLPHMIYSSKCSRFLTGFVGTNSAIFMTDPSHFLYIHAWITPWSYCTEMSVSINMAHTLNKWNEESFVMATNLEKKQWISLKMPRNFFFFLLRQETKFYLKLFNLLYCNIKHKITLLTLQSTYWIYIIFYACI